MCIPALIKQVYLFFVAPSRVVAAVDKIYQQVGIVPAVGKEHFFIGIVPAVDKKPSPLVAVSIIPAANFVNPKIGIVPAINNKNFDIGIITAVAAVYFLSGRTLYHAGY